MSVFLFDKFLDFYKLKKKRNVWEISVFLVQILVILQKWGKFSPNFQYQEFALKILEIPDSRCLCDMLVLTFATLKSSVFFLL
jgi:hypothetical protein